MPRPRVANPACVAVTAAISMAEYETVERLSGCSRSKWIRAAIQEKIVRDLNLDALGL